LPVRSLADAQHVAADGAGVVAWHYSGFGAVSAPRCGKWLTLVGVAPGAVVVAGVSLRVARAGIRSQGLGTGAGERQEVGGLAVGLCGIA
jgi:hypothetical protein